jgi:hypothetical protein
MDLERRVVCVKFVQQHFRLVRTSNCRVPGSSARHLALCAISSGKTRSRCPGAISSFPIIASLGISLPPKFRTRQSPDFPPACRRTIRQYHLSTSSPDCRNNDRRPRLAAILAAAVGLREHRDWRVRKPGQPQLPPGACKTPQGAQGQIGLVRATREPYLARLACLGDEKENALARDHTESPGREHHALGRATRSWLGREGR